VHRHRCQSSALELAVWIAVAVSLLALDIEQIACALALELLRHRDYGSSILERVKHNRDCRDALAGAGVCEGSTQRIAN
jgi:hypothetical protein